MSPLRFTSLALVLGFGLVITGAAGSASADGTPQTHHCKLADGTFDATKTNKQCTAAKGTWAKDVAYTGALLTQVNAIGGETTGVVLTLADKTTYELDLHGDKALVTAGEVLAGKPVVVTGYLTTKKGVEIAVRHIVVVSSLTAAPAKK